MNRPTFLSLFSGIGGFDLGLERAGWECVGQVEIDLACRNKLADHYPTVPRWADITEVNPHELPAADLVCGGFPCQDISVAGRRAGLAGARSALWWQFHRIVAARRPRWVIVENVPGLLSSNDGRDLGAILGALGELGYGWAYRVLDAQHFGLAQRRRRVFIVGCLGDRRAPAQVLFEPEGGQGHPPSRRTAGAGVAASLTAGVAAARGVNAPGRRADDDVNLVAYGISSDAVDRSGEGAAGNAAERAGLGIVEDVSPALRAHGPNAVATTLRSHPRPGSNSDGTIVGTLGTVPPDGGWRVGADEAAAGQLVVGALTGAVHGGADDHDAQAGHLIAQPITAREAKGPDSEVTSGNLVSHALVAEGADVSEDGTGRGTPMVVVPVRASGAAGANGLGVGRAGAPSLTLDTDGSAAIAGTAVRRLTPTECERLQGFPDGWTAAQADSVRYRQLGNAVAVPVAEWIARCILKVDAA
jgi:DNA (cytosine-5)-methyltransferase 1